LDLTQAHTYSGVRIAAEPQVGGATPGSFGGEARLNEQVPGEKKKKMKLTMQTDMAA
jgi:hypothetical protein